MFGLSDDSITYLFSKLLNEPSIEPSGTPNELWNDMMATDRFHIEHGPDDNITPKVLKIIKLKETIAPASETY